MARFVDFEFAVGPVARTVALWICGLGLAILSVNALGAQDDKIPTFHAYTNLVQIPVLVLNQERRPMAPIAERKFFVSLDGGPRFRVTHVRLEGDDPISLAILLDLSQSDPRLMEKIDDAIASLSPLYLHAKDRASIYSLDCRLIRSADDAATDSATLKQHVDTVLQFWRARGRKRAKGDCQKPWNLWDALASITQALHEQPGRRVILVVTDGVDRGSRNSWNVLRSFAQERGVAIFGFVQPADMNASLGMGLAREGVLNSVCELTGGMVLTAGERDLTKQFGRFMTLVRGRYVVEFPRPVGVAGGQHDMDISIEKTNAFIRSAGISVPVDDPAILKDPTTIPSDPSHAPAMGKRRVLTPY
jgi:VWFA-related protein